MNRVSKGTLGDVAKNEFTQSSISLSPHGGMSSTGPSTTGSTVTTSSMSTSTSVVNSLANGSSGKAGVVSTATTTTINTVTASHGGWNDRKVEDETATKKECTLKAASRTECTLAVTSASTTTSFAANIATLAQSTCDVVIVDAGTGPTATGVNVTATGASNSMPSKEEMKQMIKEVVDDVIRSTITQVINEKVAAATVTGSLIGQTLHPVLNNQLGGSNMSNGLSSTGPAGSNSSANEIIVTSDSIVTTAGSSEEAGASRGGDEDRLTKMNLASPGQVVSCQCNCPESSLTASTSSGDTSGGGGCGDSGSSIQSSDGSLGTGSSHRILPSVTTLDKAAEERAKSIEAAKAEEDLLLLLKSPEVEVKNFLLKPKKHSKSAASTSPSASASPSSASALTSASVASTGTVTTSTTTTSAGDHHSSTILRREQEHSSVSTVSATLQEVKKEGEKAKELTHQLTTEQMDESSVNQPSKCNSVTDTVKSTSTGGQSCCKDVQSTASNCDTSACTSSSSTADVIYANSQHSQVNSVTPAAPGANSGSGQKATGQDKCASDASDKKHFKCPVMDDSDAATGDAEETQEEVIDKDDGEYESIRFDREDLDPKSCLGFAPFVTASNEPGGGPSALGASGLGAANCNPLTKVAGDDIQGGEDAPWKGHPIKLNQLDLSKYIHW